MSVNERVVGREKPHFSVIFTSSQVILNMKQCCFAARMLVLEIKDTNRESAERNTRTLEQVEKG